MPNRNLRYRYSRNTQGANIQGFYNSNDNAIFANSGATDFANFAATAANGDIGVFLESGFAVDAAPGASGNDKLSPGDKFFIAQKVDDNVKKSVTMTYAPGDKLEIRKSAYDAPVLQKVAIGADGAGNGFLNIAFSGALQEWVVRVSDLTPGNQPFPIMEGRAITRLGAGGDIYDDVIVPILKDLNAQYDFEQNSDDLPFVVAEVTNNGTAGDASAGASMGFVNGSTTVTTLASNVAQLGKFISVTDGGVKRVYKVIAATANSLTLDRPYTGPTNSALAAANILFDDGSVFTGTDAAGGFGILITAVVEPTIFEVGLGEDLQGQDITTLTAWKKGSGAGWQVHFMEEESQVLDGWTTLNEAFVNDYGAPTKFVPFDTDTNFDIWFLDYRKGTPSAGAPIEVTEHLGLCAIAAPQGGTLAGNLDTVFGT